MIVKAVREGLGRIIVFIDFLTRPKKLQRSAEEQKRVEQVAKDWALYQIYACPFCVKVRRAIHRLNVPVTLRDAQNDPQHREALKTGGGRIKTPCLRIEEKGSVRWVYESKDIIKFLEARCA